MDTIVKMPSDELNRSDCVIRKLKTLKANCSPKESWLPILLQEAISEIQFLMEENASMHRRISHKIADWTIK